MNFLPNTHIGSNQEIFGEIMMGWNMQGLYLTVEVHQPFEHSSPTEVSRGDGIEIFIDTRDQKSYNITRFCHHFIFLPVAVDNVLSKEVTEFSIENKRKLADPIDLINNVTFNKKGYKMDICILEKALYQFNPIDIPTIGFTYLLHRNLGFSQYFSASPKEFKIEKVPRLWASGKLQQH